MISGRKKWMLHLLPRRFAYQQVLLIALLVGAAIVSTTAYFIIENVTQEFRKAEQRFGAMANNLALGCSHHLLAREISAIDMVLLQAANYPNIHSIAVIDPARRVRNEVQQLSGQPPQLLFNMRTIDPPPGAGTQFIWRHGQRTRGSPLLLGLDAISLETWQPIENGQLGWLRIESDVNDIRAAALHALEDGLYFMLFATVLSVLLLFLFLRPRLRALATATEFAESLKNVAGQKMPVFSDSLELEHLSLVLNETSQQLYAQDIALKKSHAETTALLENIRDVIITIDERGIVRSANNALMDMLDYAPEELVGQNVSVLVPEAHRAAYDDYLQRYFDAGVARAVIIGREVEAQHKNGQLIPVRLAVSEYTLADERYFACILTDLREQRARLEAELAQRAAENASRTKSAFLANMSHEIRTPMNGVIGMIDVLLNTPLGENQKKMAKVIRDSAYTQLDILNDILDFSKIEAGKLELSSEPFSVGDVVEKTCFLLNGQAAQKQVRLTCSVDPRMPKVLKGDPLRVRQIITNLATNAIKFSSGPQRQGQVSVEARVIKEEKDRIWAEISVQDNGIGMDEAALARLFQSFQQADASTTRRFGGTGLGLVISRRLAEMMEGDIRVESTPGAGSTFTLRIPFARVDESVQPAMLDDARQDMEIAAYFAAPTREEALRQGRLILVAEDNEINQEVIRQQLNMLGFAADIADDGREAYEQWLTGQYKLVLSDLHMPHMDGYRLTGAIREQEAKAGAARTSIVALTANALKGEAEHCMAVGMDDYLSKPTPLPELKAILEKWMPRVNAVPDAPMGMQPSRAAEVPAEAAATVQSGEQGGATPGSPATGDAELPVWDETALTRMVGDNPDMHRTLLEKFLANAQKRVIAILAAAAAGEIAAVGDMAHALKSAARTVGALRLGELCQQMERAGKGGDAVACTALSGQLNGVFEAAAEEIRQNLN